MGVKVLKVLSTSPQTVCSSVYRLRAIPNPPVSPSVYQRTPSQTGTDFREKVRPPTIVVMVAMTHGPKA